MIEVTEVIDIAVNYSRNKLLIKDPVVSTVSENEFVFVVTFMTEGNSIEYGKRDVIVYKKDLKPDLICLPSYPDNALEMVKKLKVIYRN